MMAAGRGTRLGGGQASGTPKVLLRLGGRSLLDRHVEILKACGIDELVMVVGYRAELIAAEIDALGAGDYVRTLFNPDFERSSLLSFWTLREEMRAGDDILFMDGDVLYHPALIERLVDSPMADCLLIDRDFEPGDEPVKLCLRDGAPVEFRKKVEVAYDTVGEWPGFLRFSPRIARRIADALDDYVRSDRVDQVYEEPMRDVFLSEPPGTFAIADVTGLPWIEIDFPADLIRAETQVLPRIEQALAATAARRAKR